MRECVQWLAATYAFCTAVAHRVLPAPGRGQGMILRYLQNVNLQAREAQAMQRDANYTRSRFITQLRRAIKRCAMMWAVGGVARIHFYPLWGT